MSTLTLDDKLVEKLHHIYNLVHDGHYIEDDDEFEEGLSVAYEISKKLFENKLEDKDVGDNNN